MRKTDPGAASHNPAVTQARYSAAGFTRALEPNQTRRKVVVKTLLSQATVFMGHAAYLSARGRLRLTLSVFMSPHDPWALDI